MHETKGNPLRAFVAVTKAKHRLTKKEREYRDEISQYLKRTGQPDQKKSSFSSKYARARL
jgi:hypothetical protein